MDYLIICIVAFIGSGLTVFSGFGLGTMLLPTFAVFFPLELSVALTAIVHFLNNIFKLFLLGKFADKNVLLRFGIPSVIFAFIGALVLTRISDSTPLFTYHAGGHDFTVLPLKLTIGIVLVVFALIEVIPRLSKIQFDKRHMWLGGVLSGFFGGLTGNQGALRSAFLIRANLSKESFIGTAVFIACLIDITRLSVYSKHILNQRDSLNLPLITAATLSAFAGAFIGSRYIEKVTLKTVHYFVTAALILFGSLLALGMV